MPEFVPVSRTRQRYTFGRAHDLIDMPDMIEVQRDSYQWFYQDDVEPDARRAQGLQELLQEIFPIESYDGQFSLEFVRYYIDPPERSEEEARPIRETNAHIVELFAHGGLISSEWAAALGHRHEGEGQA